MKIEVITLNKEDTMQAEQLGADRVELVSAMEEGGLTPSYGTIKTVLSNTSIPAQIMVRPHSFSFVYDEKDWEIIKEDISTIINLGGNRIVFGAITKEGDIDEGLLTKVIDHAPELDITFHRAFDHATSQIDAYKVLTKYKSNIKRILTSGGEDNAPNAIPQLQKLVDLSKELNGPTILVGSGVTPENINFLHEKIKASEYHIGSGIRMEGAFFQGLSEEKMKQIKK